MTHNVGLAPATADNAAARANGPLHGRIVRLRTAFGYGFVAATDGRMVYFHRDSIPGGGFGSLREGSDVWLVVSDGDCIGPRAISVHPVGRTP